MKAPIGDKTRRLLREGRGKELVKRTSSKSPNKTIEVGGKNYTIRQLGL